MAFGSDGAGKGCRHRAARQLCPPRPAAKIGAERCSRAGSSFLPPAGRAVLRSQPHVGGVEMGLRSGADGKDFPCPEARSSAGAAGAAAAWRRGASFKREMGWKSSEWPQSSGAGGGGSQRGGGRRGVRVPSVSPRSAEAGALSVPCARRLVLSQPLRRGEKKGGGDVGFCTMSCSGSELGGLARPQGAQNKGKGGTRARLAACRCLFVPVPVGPLAAQSLRCHLCPMALFSTCPSLPCPHCPHCPHRPP